MEEIQLELTLEWPELDVKFSGVYGETGIAEFSHEGEHHIVPIPAAEASSHEQITDYCARLLQR